jgi:HTH-like domain
MVCFGYRRLHRMLRRDKEHGTANWVVNHKLVYRIYREEGLAIESATERGAAVEPQSPYKLWARAPFP